MAEPLDNAQDTRRYRAGESIEDICRVCKMDRMHTVIVVDYSCANNERTKFVLVFDEAAIVNKTKNKY